jgi:integrase/recombinase XerD
MPGRQAKLLSQRDLRRALGALSNSRTPERDRVIVLLSVRAGLRACEIARLEWNMVRTAQGQVGRVIEIRDAIAKRGRGRRIPMHAELRRALADLSSRDGALDGPVVRSARGGPMRANSIVNWFVTLFQKTGALGCSSHSGRRTFITKAARSAHTAGASLRDVQLLAGHRSIETTQGYIDGDTDAQRRLVARL